MKLRSFLFLITAATIFLSMLHDRAIACSCQFVGGGPPCSDYWKAAAVFTGKVVEISTILVEIEPGNPKWKTQERVIRFSIEKTFKGRAGKEVELITGMTTASCGYHFKVGERYLVYAIPYAKLKNRLFSSICHRTRLLSQAEEDLAYFQALPPPGSGGTLYGRLTMPNPDNIKITIEGQGKRIETRANKDGYYRLSGLVPGEYKVTADLPKEIPHNPYYMVRVTDRACNQLNL
jgi:hypothetical protein